MPSQERNEGPQEYNHEEWQTGNSRRMPNLWHQDVQDRKGLIQKKEGDAGKIIDFLARR
jgi:hypothetical protein